MGLFKPTGAAGVELDTGVIRVVELKGKAGSATLTAAGKIDLPEGAVAEGVVADQEAVTKALQELWSKAGIGKSSVVLGISNQGVLMRLANFPKMPEKKLAQAVRFQAGEHFPIPLNQMVFDFSVVGEASGENGPLLEVLLVAARRDMLDKSLKALAGAGLQPDVVDTSPLALMRTVPKEKFTTTVLLADISNGLSTLVLVDGGVPRFARVIPHSLSTYAKELDQPLAEILGGARQAAAASEGRQDPAETLEEWGRVLANEIRSSVGYYLSQKSEGSVDLIMLSGRGARIPGLAVILRDELSVPVEVVKPTAGITGSSQISGVDLQREGPEFAVSIGLALRGLEA